MPAQPANSWDTKGVGLTIVCFIGFDEVIADTSAAALSLLRGAGARGWICVQAGEFDAGDKVAARFWAIGERLRCQLALGRG